MVISKNMKDKIIELHRQGVSKSQIARKLKISRPVIIAKCKEITNKKEEENNSQNEGELAAKAFELFEKGKTPVDVVKELKQKPSKILELWKTFTDLSNWPSGLLYDNIHHLLGMSCDTCGENYDPTNLVIVYCRDCNNAIFYGSDAELDIVREANDWEYIEE